MVIHMYIAPGQGQTTLWDKNVFISMNILSICSFLASFLPLIDIFLFFPFKCKGGRKISQGHPKVMIYINFVELLSLMLHTKFQDHRPSGSGKEDF